MTPAQKRAMQRGATASNIRYWLILGPILFVVGGFLLLALLFFVLL